MFDFYIKSSGMEEVSFRSVKINVPTVYLKYHLVFVTDLLKTCVLLISDKRPL